MKAWFTILLFFVCSVSMAQFGVKENMRFLDEALVSKDTTRLKQLLHPDLSYGHSNGWVESRNELVQHLYNGKLTYQEITTREISREETGDITLVRAESQIKFLLDGRPGALKLHVLQVWLKVGATWQLVARQSAKLGDH